MVTQSADRPRVFVSHCTEADRDEAVRAVQLLESSGLSAWIAPRDIHEGEDHAEAIARAIPECAALLLVLSGPALESPHVAIEAELALSARVPIVPVVLPSFPGFTGLTDAWRYRLAKTQVRTDSDLERAVHRCLDIALPKPARPRVFLSHAREDVDAADELAGALTEAGIDCWIAHKRILPGRSWAGMIADALSEVDALIVLVSDASLDSPNVGAEVSMALDDGLAVIPVRLREVRLHGELRYHLNRLHWVDALETPRGPAFASLARRIAEQGRLSKAAQGDL